MSGISSRLNYDTCAISQQTKTLCAQGGYFLELYSYVNPTLQTAKDVVCLNVEKTVGCLPCDTNKNATLELGPQSFIQRAEIEDNLRGTKRNLTMCASDKFLSCEMNTPNRIKGECSNMVTVNPALCERNIVPTNIKFPTSKGF
jgi:hypothetical protein